MYSIFDKYTPGNSDETVLRGLEECREAKLLGEGDINVLGYEYLIEHKKTKTAEAIFKANTILYPNSANVFDSYAESLMLNGDLESSLKNYQIAVELAIENEDGNLEAFKKNLESVKVKINSEK